MSFGASGYTAIAGAVSSAIGSYYSAKNAKINLKLQSDLAEINARMAERSAQSALLAGQQQVAGLTLRAGMLKSSQRASMAANGVDLGEGNAAEIQASTDLMKEIDKNTMEANALQAAWGYRTQSSNFRTEAFVREGAARGVNPGMSAGTSLLSSAGSVAEKWRS